MTSSEYLCFSLVSVGCVVSSLGWHRFPPPSTTHWCRCTRIYPPLAPIESAKLLDFYQSRINKISIAEPIEDLSVIIVFSIYLLIMEDWTYSAPELGVNEFSRPFPLENIRVVLICSSWLTYFYLILHLINYRERENKENKIERYFTEFLPSQKTNLRMSLSISYNKNYVTSTFNTVRKEIILIR